MSDTPTSASGPAAPSGATGGLADLPFPELRTRAFHLAEKRHDWGFFTDLFGHMPGMAAIEGEGGDLGAVGGTFIETVKAVREMLGDANLPPDTEALLRARFVTYLEEHEA